MTRHRRIWIAFVAVSVPACAIPIDTSAPSWPRSTPSPSPGSPVPPGLDCLGVPAHSTRGRFSTDPEIDRILSCTMEAIGGGTKKIGVDLEINSGCLVGQDSRYGRTAITSAGSWSLWSDLQAMLSQGGPNNTLFGRTRDEYAELLVRIDERGGTTRLTTNDAHDVLGMIGDMMLNGPAVPVSASLGGPDLIRARPERACRSR